MKVINGNLLNVTKGVIIHQVNNKRVMGAGLAKQIRAKYPKHYGEYLSNKLEMGTVVQTMISSDLWVFGFVAQNGYGRDRCYTEYASFSKCLVSLQKFHYNNPDLPIYMPYGIGCGLAGGDWNMVEHLISVMCPYVILVKY